MYILQNSRRRGEVAEVRREARGGGGRGSGRGEVAEVGVEALVGAKDRTPEVDT